MAKLKKLGDVLPKSMFETTYKDLNDYYDKPLIFHSATPVKGKWGDYMRCVVSETEEGEQFYLACGATQPQEVLKYLNENHSYPVVGVFRKLGKAVILADPEDKVEQPPEDGKESKK